VCVSYADRDPAAQALDQFHDVVVLPAPLGPTRPKHEPAGTSRSSLAHRDGRPERLVEAPQRDGGSLLVRGHA
jgi:hypothetical protein